MNDGLRATFDKFKDGLYYIASHFASVVEKKITTPEGELVATCMTKPNRHSYLNCLCVLSNDSNFKINVELCSQCFDGGVLSKAVGFRCSCGDEVDGGEVGDQYKFKTSWCGKDSKDRDVGALTLQFKRDSKAQNSPLNISHRKLCVDCGHHDPKCKKQINKITASTTLTSASTSASTTPTTTSAAGENHSNDTDPRVLSAALGEGKRDSVTPNISPIHISDDESKHANALLGDEWPCVILIRGMYVFPGWDGEKLDYRVWHRVLCFKNHILCSCQGKVRIYLVQFQCIYTPFCSAYFQWRYVLQVRAQSNAVLFQWIQRMKKCRKSRVYL